MPLSTTFQLYHAGFIGGGNHRPSHRQTLSHNVISSTPRLSGIRTHVSGDKCWLHR